MGSSGGERQWGGVRPLEPCRLLSRKNWATAKEMKPGSCRLAGPFGPILPSVQKGLAAGSPVWEPGGHPRGRVASARLPPSPMHHSANERSPLLCFRDTDISGPDAFRGPSRGGSRDGGRQRLGAVVTGQCVPHHRPQPAQPLPIHLDTVLESLGLLISQGKLKRWILCRNLIFFQAGRPFL